MQSYLTKFIGKSGQTGLAAVDQSILGQAPRALSSSLTAPLRFSDRSRGTEALHVLAKTANFEEAVLLLSKWR
ncbi:MAG: hypothetical protein COW84_01445 [Gammaproteobacteria bacterium CG22_combo_CG10-13_8_21_14_all_40_8]|nr:MAG: hypothetical protein COW84_01445 [Gammaproteobacteria bacterium CG22_combo_CG10-13_8_21_14_all_40_8]